MADKNNNYDHKRENKKNTRDKDVINSMVAGAAGAVIGAGVAIAGAAVLRDEKNREKVKYMLSKVKDQATETLHDARDTAMEKKDQVQDKVLDGKEVKSRDRKSLE